MSLLNRAGVRLYLVQRGGGRDAAMPELALGYTVEKSDPERLRPWAETTPGLSHEFLDAASARGDRCVANFFRGELVGYGFVASAWAPVTRQLRVEIDQALFYRYKGWTHPEHRRQYLSHARGRLNSALFPDSDPSRMVSYVDTHNYASKLHHAEIHPVHLGYAGYVTLFGRQIPFTTPGCRARGFQLSRIEAAQPQGA